MYEKEYPTIAVNSNNKPAVGELKFGGVNITCKVLSDGKRVLSERKIMEALGVTRRGDQAKIKREGGAEIPLFLAFKSLFPFINNDLGVVRFQHEYLEGNEKKTGFRADGVVKVLAIWIEADQAGALKGVQQRKIAENSRILLEILGQEGIDSWIDDATSFKRPAGDVSRFIAQMISQRVKPWQITFTEKFYRPYFACRGVDPDEYFDADGNRLKHIYPSYVGIHTNNLIYDRLAPTLGREVKKILRRNKNGLPLDKMHQHLSEDGREMLIRHLDTVSLLLKVAGPDNWEVFMHILDEECPKFENIENQQLGFHMPLKLKKK